MFGEGRGSRHASFYKIREFSGMLDLDGAERSWREVQLTVAVDDRISRLFLSGPWYPFFLRVLFPGYNET